jgi:hypothetical protein
MQARLLSGPDAPQESGKPGVVGFNHPSAILLVVVRLVGCVCDLSLIKVVLLFVHVLPPSYGLNG